jgi:hypothetical protein
MGPLPQLSVRAHDGSQAGIGDTVVIEPGKGAQLEVTGSVDFNARSGYWELPDQKLQLKLVSNRGELGCIELTRGVPEANLILDVTDVRWLRGELHGVFCKARTRIGFTNAIYFT